MKKVVVLVMLFAALAAAGNFQRKNVETVHAGSQDPLTGWQADTVYVKDKPANIIKHRYGRVYIRKEYSTGTEHNQAVRVYYSEGKAVYCGDHDCRNGKSK